MNSTVPFGSICQLQNGRAFQSCEWAEAGVPIVRIQNLNNEDKTFNYCTLDIESRFHVNTGDLLFSWSGTPGTSFGAFFWNRGLGYLNQHIFRVDIDHSRVEKNYLRYAINAQLNIIIEQAHGGVGLKHITKGRLEAVEVPLPMLNQQKRIAAILDKADSIRRKRREALTLADDFLRTVFLEMFGDPVLNDMDWPVAALDTVADVRSGATKGRKLQDKPTITLPYMRVANVQDGRLALDDIQEIEVLTSEVNKYSLQAGDLLLTEGGDPDKLGRGAVWNAELLQCLHQNHIFAVRANTVRVLPEFLSAQISSLRGKRYFLKVGKQTTGIATINKTVLSQYPTLVPPLAAQQKYVEVTAKIRSYKESLQIALQASEEFFSANSAKLLSA